MLQKDRLPQMLESLNSKDKKFLELIPISATKEKGGKQILDSIVKYLPDSPYLYDPEFLTDQTVKEIYRTMSRRLFWVLTSRYGTH